MAPTTLPHVIDAVCGVDSRSPEFVEHYADQLALITRLLGLDPTQPAEPTPSS
jgi:TetR/AcrR family transcriptional regulator